MSLKAMERVWDREKPKGSERFVLICLADEANDLGVCWPGIKRIARKTGYTVRTVSRIIERLKAEGEITVLRKRGMGNWGPRCGDGSGPGTAAWPLAPQWLLLP